MKITREMVQKISAIVIQQEMKNLQRAWSRKIDLYSVVCDRVNRPFIDNTEADSIVESLSINDQSIIK
jgi:hypothetical protein